MSSQIYLQKYNGGKNFHSQKWWELLEGSKLYISNELGRHYKGSFNEDKDCHR